MKIARNQDERATEARWRPTERKGQSNGMSAIDERGERVPIVDAEDGEIQEPQVDANERRAFWAFLGIEGVAFAIFVAIGRRLWFHNDEWDFLAARTSGNLGDLFRPHGNVHPSALPVLAYRLLWTLFGLRTYLPYQVLVLSLHFGAALLVRAVIRRAGVRPWTATITASLLVFFGAGYQDIMWPFQIGFVGAVVFGFAQLLLADHDGPLDRRDGLALLAGLAAMLCSAVAVTTVLAVGIATVLRRGWRVAALQCLPLEFLYFVWWATLARPHYDAGAPRVGLVARFVIRTVVNTFGALGQLPGVGVVLVLVLVYGFGLAYKNDPRAIRTRLAAPTALLIGALLFVANTGLGRAEANNAAGRSRYLYVAALMLMPALAVAADAVARRWRKFAPVVFACFLVGIPGNLGSLSGATHRDDQVQQRVRRMILVSPHLPVAARFPRALPLAGGISTGFPYMHIGWLVDGAANGRIPSPGRISPAEAATDTLRLLLTDHLPNLSAAAATRCVNPRTPVRLRLDVGQVIVLREGVFRFLPVPNPPGDVLQFTFDAGKSGTLVGVVSGPVDTTVVSRNKKPVLCAPKSAYAGGQSSPVTP
jgi:hypothetical protein